MWNNLMMSSLGFLLISDTQTWSLRAGNLEMPMSDRTEPFPQKRAPTKIYNYLHFFSKFNLEHEWDSLKYLTEPSSRCGAVEINPISIHGDAGFNPWSCSVVWGFSVAMSCDAGQQLPFCVKVGMDFFFVFLRAIPVAYGNSQARGPMGAIAAGLHHSHSNVGSQPCLWPFPHLTAMPNP